MDKIYNHMKVFHFKEKIDSLPSEKILPPIHIRIKPTNNCNHNCSYCAYRTENDTKEFDAVDFIASLCSHIPNKSEQMVRYVGLCIKLEKTDTQNCFCGHLKLFMRTPNIEIADTLNHPYFPKKNKLKCFY